MDVQVTLDAASAAYQLIGSASPSTPAPSPDPTPAPVSSATPAAPQVPVPASNQPGAANASSAPAADLTLAPAISKLFGGDDLNPVEVSFRPEGGEVVTIFTDKKSGREIVQFPSEVLVQIAKYFEKLAGAVIDKKA